MGRFNCLALVLILGDPVRAAGHRLVEEIGACPVSHRAPLVVSASALAGGALLRIAGERVEDVGREIHRRLSFVSELLHEDPWARKW